jgi:hypothetical protein
MGGSTCERLRRGPNNGELFRVSEFGISRALVCNNDSSWQSEETVDYLKLFWMARRAR